jgi:membrane protein involved in colicin uptake
MLAPPVQQLLESRKQGQEPLPPQIQQQMQQGQQIIEHLTKTVQELEKQQQADTVKQQAESQRAMLKAQTDKELKAMELKAKSDEAAEERANKVLIARISAGAKGTPADPAAAAREEQISLGIEQEHEIRMAAADAGHEQSMAAAEHDRAMELAATNAAHARDAAITDAALQPPPTNGNGA